MRVSISFSGFAAIEPSIAAVQAAEQCGLDGVWSAEHITFHDAIVPTTVYLRATERIDVGIVGLSWAGRHPAMLAMELSSLAEIANGRFRIQVGTGDPGLIGKLGRTLEKPAASTAAFVMTLRELLAGRELTQSQLGYDFKQFKIQPMAPCPAIDVMAMRPGMIKTACRVADGISLSVGASKQYLRDVVALVESELAANGRSRADFRITAFCIASVNEDLDAARGPLKPMLSMFPPDGVAVLATGVLGPDFVEAVETGGPFAAMKLITPEVIDQIALVSTPDGLGDALAGYADTGVDELALMFLNPAEEMPTLVKQLAAARDGLSDRLTKEHTQ
jgi:5,10-methylenetetrahydromethanopterin reductase